MALDPELERFAREHSAALLRFGLALTGNRHDAEDLVQTALMRTALRWGSVQEPGAYVRRAMVRLHLNWRTRLRARMTGEPLPELPAPPVDSDTRLVVWRALGALPPRQRAILVLRYYEDMSEAEIADTLGVTRGTVKSAAARALTRLRTDPALAGGALADGGSPDGTKVRTAPTAPVPATAEGTR